MQLYLCVCVPPCAETPLPAAVRTGRLSQEGCTFVTGGWRALGRGLLQAHPAFPARFAILFLFYFVLYFYTAAVRARLHNTHADFI